MPTYFFYLVDNANHRIVRESRFKTSSYSFALKILSDYNKGLKKSKWILVCK